MNKTCWKRLLNSSASLYMISVFSYTVFNCNHDIYVIELPGRIPLRMEDCALLEPSYSELTDESNNGCPILLIITLGSRSSH